LRWALQGVRRVGHPRLINLPALAGKEWCTLFLQSQAMFFTAGVRSQNTAIDTTTQTGCNEEEIEYLISDTTIDTTFTNSDPQDASGDTRHLKPCVIAEMLKARLSPKKLALP